MHISIHIMLESTFFHLLWLFSIKGISLHNKDCIYKHTCQSQHSPHSFSYAMPIEVFTFNGHHLPDYSVSCFVFQATDTASRFSGTLQPLSSKPHLPLIPRHKMFPSTRSVFVLGAQPFPALSAHQPVSHSCGLDDGSRQRTGMNVSWRRNGAQVEGLG